MKRIVVYCGSQTGSNKEMERRTLELGRYLASKDMTLVFGGYTHGLMGLIAKGVAEGRGKVIGVTIPRFRGPDNEDPSWKLIVAKDLSERRKTMMDLGDGFIALPGAFGTLDELTEVMVEASLALNNKPIGILNVDNYYTPFLQWRQHMQATGFEDEMRKGKLDARLVVAEHACDLLDQMIERSKQLNQSAL